MTVGEKTAVPLDGVSARTFARFYAVEYEPQMRRALVLARTPEAAADAVHDAFVDVLRQWDELESPGGYLSVAVVNRCRDSGRRATSRDRLRLRLVAERKVGGNDHATDRDDLSIEARDAELWAALLELPFNHRAVIALRYFGGHSEAEIAQLLECSPGSVGPWIRRGLNRLRRELNDGRS